MYCPKCGKEVNAQDAFCKNCGASILSDTVHHSQTESSTNSQKVMIELPKVNLGSKTINFYAMILLSIGNIIILLQKWVHITASTWASDEFSLLELFDTAKRIQNISSYVDINTTPVTVVAAILWVLCVVGIALHAIFCFRLLTNAADADDWANRSMNLAIVIPVVVIVLIWSVNVILKAETEVSFLKKILSLSAFPYISLGLGIIGRFYFAKKLGEEHYYATQSTYNPSAKPVSSAYDVKLDNTSWKCPKCGKINKNYITTCTCGESKHL
jgi:predicted RNA-binding Zn-ribbon protein involved in translation (DUF1610 family)